MGEINRKTVACVMLADDALLAHAVIEMREVVKITMSAAACEPLSK